MSDAVAFDLEARRAAIAGTRQFVAEETFDAILELLTKSGAVSPCDAAIMCDRLSKRLERYETGLKISDWQLCHRELREQSARLAAKAACLRAVVASARGRR